MKKEEVKPPKELTYLLADLSLEDSDKFTSKSGRSEFQTTFLFNLVGKNLNKLVALEERIKNNHLHYCPGDKEEVKKVLKMGRGSYWFDMHEYKTSGVRFDKLWQWFCQRHERAVTRAKADRQKAYEKFQTELKRKAQGTAVNNLKTWANQLLNWQ